MKKVGFYFYIKRLLDIFISFILLIILALPMLLIAISISLTSKGGVIFRQERIGVGGERFVCYKFRTMYKWAPGQMPTSVFVDAENYITPIGGWLRRYSLDELPQLFNVLLGDMSLVGPRPLIEEEGEIHELRRRCGVYSLRPGMTGLAQVSGRDDLCDIDKARLDAKYARSVSLSSDAKIIFKTLFGVVSGKGFSR